MMALTPFAAGSFTARRGGETFATMRRDLDDLQRQLATTKRSETYSGLGLGRRTSLDARARLAGIEGYQEAIASGDLRLKVMRQGLESLSKTLTGQKQHGALATFDSVTGGRVALQQTAMNNLKHTIEVLNADVNGRYLYAGRKDDTRPVADLDTILNGAGGRIGLRQAIADGKTADLGDPLGPPPRPGHLAASASGSVATLAETSASHGFSLRPADAQTGSASIAIAHAAGAVGSRNLTFTITGAVADGEVVRFSLGLKDGTSIPVEIRARTGGTAADAASFQIGATAGATAANLSEALRLAATAATADPRFSAASATAAADRFFAGVEPGAVQWYHGEGGATAWLAGEPDLQSLDQLYSNEARAGVPVRADAAQAIGIGARANELAFRNALSGLAVMAVETFSTDPAQRSSEEARYKALLDRTAVRLDATTGVGNVKQVITELANATISVSAASERHQHGKKIWQEALAGVENANLDEVATAIRLLQVRMEASYQTTSILSRLSLVNYL